MLSAGGLPGLMRRLRFGNGEHGEPGGVQDAGQGKMPSTEAVAAALTRFAGTIQEDVFGAGSPAAPAEPGDGPVLFPVRVSALPVPAHSCAHLFVPLPPAQLPGGERRCVPHPGRALLPQKAGIPGV
jgi:hypothetical protein